MNAKQITETLKGNKASQVLSKEYIDTLVKFLLVDNIKMKEALYLSHEHLKLIKPEYCKGHNIFDLSEEVLNAQ